MSKIQPRLHRNVKIILFTKSQHSQNQTLRSDCKIRFDHVASAYDSDGVRLVRSFHRAGLRELSSPWKTPAAYRLR